MSQCLSLHLLGRGPLVGGGVGEQETDGREAPIRQEDERSWTFYLGGREAEGS